MKKHILIIVIMFIIFTITDYNVYAFNLPTKQEIQELNILLRQKQNNPNIHVKGFLVLAGGSYTGNKESILYFCEPLSIRYDDKVGITYAEGNYFYTKDGSINQSYTSGKKYEYDSKYYGRVSGYYNYDPTLGTFVENPLLPQVSAGMDLGELESSTVSVIYLIASSAVLILCLLILPTLLKKVLGYFLNQSI